MDLQTIQEKFNTHLKCVKHLERARWGNEPFCAHGCENSTITVRKGNDKTPKYHCNSCNKDFTVLTGTIFEASKLPLQKWFMIITLMLNARKGISAMQVMRDVGINYKAAWYSAMRVRCAMLDQAYMLEGIVEMDEMYVGGKPRHRNTPTNVANIGYTSVETDSWQGDKKKIDKRKFNKGRGSDNKVAVVGIVERGRGEGRVSVKVQDTLTSADLIRLLKRYVKMDSATVMTDDFSSYKAFDKIIQHYTVNHSKKEYVKYLKDVKEAIHTNTIEGFWSIIKNGIKGQYHVLSKKYLPFYLAEAAYKYNRRSHDKKEEAFEETIDNAVTEEKCEVNYKPKAYPRFLAYKRRKPKVKKKRKAAVKKGKASKSNVAANKAKTTTTKKSKAIKRKVVKTVKKKVIAKKVKTKVVSKKTKVVKPKVSAKKKTAPPKKKVSAKKGIVDKKKVVVKKSAKKAIKKRGRAS